MIEGVTRIHLDTDLGSDTDDLCALAMLLGWEGVELTGVTTNTDPGGIRAGYTRYALGLAGRGDIPVCAGAEGSLGGLFASLAFPDYWPVPIDRRPARPGEALELLEASIEAGATIVAIGPYTNLALLAAVKPDLLSDVRVVVMGGHVTTPREGLPQWGVDEDFNVQQDRIAAYIVLRRCRPTVVPLAVTLEVFLRSSHLRRLRAAGSLGALIADQAEMHERDNGRLYLGRSYPELPDDLMNFHYDPLACAVALGWEGVQVAQIPTLLELTDERLHTSERAGEATLDVVNAVDGPAFEEQWIRSIERVSAT